MYDLFNHSINGQYQLQTPCCQEYRFKRNLDASYFAYVRFNCTPSDKFSLSWTEEWPTVIDQKQVEKLRVAIRNGIVDAILNTDDHPYLGCSLTLTKVIYDEVGSSEQAFYIAAKLAMQALVSNQIWHFVTREKQ